MFGHSKLHRTFHSLSWAPSAESLIACVPHAFTKMSTYHATMKIMRAGKTMSHLAYITRTGKYRSKTDLLFTKSENIPEWAKNAADFWKESDDRIKERYQKQAGVDRPTSRTGRTWDFALPNELSNEELIRFTDEYMKKQFPDLPYTYAIHVHESAIHQKKNPHVHVIFSEYKMNDRARQLDRETFFKQHGISKKGREYGGAEHTWEYCGTGSKKLRELRRNLADEINRAYEEKGLPQRVTEKSIEVQREEALNAGNIRQADAFDRPKPKRLSPKKFKKYQEVISEKVREGWRDADLSNIRDKDVIDRICQEFEKQVNEEALDRMAREQIMEPTDQEKLAAVQEQLRDIDIYKTALPSRKASCSPAAEKMEEELKKHECNLLLSHTDKHIRPLQKEKYKAKINQDIQQKEIETLRSASDAEKIREYAVRLYAEQEADDRFHAALSGGDEITPEQKEDLYTLKEMANAAMERAQKAGITKDFIEENRKEIDQYTETLRTLNTIDRDEEDFERSVPAEDELDRFELSDEEINEYELTDSELEAFVPEDHELNGYDPEEQELSGYEPVGDISEGIEPAGDKLEGYEPIGEELDEFEPVGEELDGFEPIDERLDGFAPEPGDYDAFEAAEEEKPQNYWQNLLDAAVAEDINQYKMRIYTKSPAAYNEENDLEDWRSDLEKDAKRKHVSPAVRRAVKKLLSRTQTKHEQIMLRAELGIIPGSTEDKELALIEAKARKLEIQYQNDFYRLTPHTEEYELKRLVEQAGGKELATLKEQLRAEEAKKLLNEKNNNPTADNEKQIARLQRSIAERETGLRTRERIAEAASLSRESWKAWPEHRAALRKLSDELRRTTRHPLPKSRKERIQKTLDKLDKKISRQSVLDYAVKEKFTQFKNRVDTTLPRSERAYLLDLVREASAGKLEAIDEEIKYLRNAQKKLRPADRLTRTELDNRIDTASAERKELIERLTTPERQAQAAAMRIAAEENLTEKVESLRAEQARLVLRDLNRKHLSPAARRYAEEILKKTTKKLDTKQRQLDRELRKRQRDLLRTRTRIEPAKLKIANPVLDIADDLTDIPQTGTGRANLNIRHDRDIEMER